MKTLHSLLAVGVLSMTACTKVNDVFECVGNAQCRIDQLDGRCEPTGYCSLPSSDCPSQWRYDRSADPALAGQCAPEVDCAAPFSAVAGAVEGTCVEGSPPTIDGDLSDWPEQLISSEVRHATSSAYGGTWSGTDELANDADLSARVGWRWDARFLYVAAKIEDDQIIINGAEPLWNNDSFELLLDGAADRLGPYADDDHQLIIRADGVAGSRREGVAIALPVGMVAATQRTSTGWWLELAVPFAALGEMPVVPGRLVGVDVVLEDREGMTTDVAQYLTWKKLATDPVGCTTTCISSCLPSCSTAHFTTLQLGDR